MDKQTQPTYINDYQAQQLADLVESRGLMRAPANLKSAILERSRQPDVLLAAKAGRLGRRAELFFYGLKVSAAVACSVGLILAAPPIGEALPRPQPAAVRDVPIHIQLHNILTELSEKAGALIQAPINTEVSFND